MEKYNAMNKDAVLKFPDGKGGIIWKRMDPSGKWVEVNEDGSPIVPDKKEDKEVKEAAVPVKRKAGRPQKERCVKQFYISLSPDCSKDLMDYVHWRSLNDHQDFSKSDVVEEALLLLFRKSPGFIEYRKQREG